MSNMNTTTMRDKNGYDVPILDTLPAAGTYLADSVVSVQGILYRATWSRQWARITTTGGGYLLRGCEKYLSS